MIETPRLLIRLPEDEDGEPYLAIHSDPDVTRWLSGPRPLSVADELERIAARRRQQQELGYTMWTVEEKESDEVVGLAGLFHVENARPEVEVAYHFAKDRWGRGYATEAAGACIDYGFGVAGLTRIVGLVAPENTASARVLEKCGMTLEGTGRYYGRDLLVYSLVQDDDAG
ncbi:MAG: GNAT family N-acetyltransferase [Actinomycetota bacterium]|nr:GNAT family N-acetyltransferase [Actinomycetota bacterium]